MRFLFDPTAAPACGLWWQGFVVCSLLTLIGLPMRICVGAQLSPPPREYEIKAAFIYNFTKFIEWPARSFPDAATPIVIAVLGDSPCAEALEQLVKDRKVNGRAIVVRRVESARELETTHVLFVGSAQEGRFLPLMPAVAALPIVTVGESPAFADMGGAIIFVRQDDKIRFEINIRSAARVDVKISAQLLKLASAIRGGS
jgi:YfiR/HmsC-like